MTRSELEPNSRPWAYHLVLLILSLSAISITSSLTWPILSELLANRGYSDTAISINASVQFAGMIIVALMATRLIPRLGFVLSLAASFAVIAVSLFLLDVTRDYYAWLPVRFFLGAGVSLMFTAGDTWINQILDDRVRGRWLGVYTTIGMAGWAIGPMIGAAFDPETSWPFMFGIVAVVIASILFIPTHRIAFRFPETERKGTGPWTLVLVFLAAPTVLLSSAMFGILEGGIQTFAHLYTMDILGKEYRTIGYAVIWVSSLGAVFYQYPVGWLADKVDRGWLLVGCVLVLLATTILLHFAIEGGTHAWWTLPGLCLWALVSLWGGSMGAIFTVGITLLGQRFTSVDLVAANAVFSVLFGVGGMIGPILVGFSMDGIGPAGFIVSISAAIFLYVTFATFRQIQRAS